MRKTAITEMKRELMKFSELLTIAGQIEKHFPYLRKYILQFVFLNVNLFIIYYCYNSLFATPSNTKLW